MRHPLVKQGGILLFNIYTDDLSLTLSKSNIGCRFVGGRFISHIAYADDLCILSISPSGIQTLLNICEKYGSNHDIIYDSKKSLTMLLKPKKLKDLKSPSLYVCNNQLDYINNCRYLGVKIETYSCKSDMKRQLCKFYANVNMLIRKFYFCSDDVKVFLFKSYCTNPLLYTILV